MKTLIACLSTGKGTWGHVARLLDGDFDKILLITNPFGEEKFTKNEKSEFIVVDSNKGYEDLIVDVKAGIAGKVEGTEVYVNLTSGSGKEHMAILSAIMKSGLGFRLIALTKEGIKEL